MDVKKNRWLTKEYYDRDDNILPRLLYYYAFNIIKGRWPDVESIIMKDPESAYLYARFIIWGRWPEAEPYIMKNPRSACLYACSIIKGRWPEVEDILNKINIIGMSIVGFLGFDYACYYWFS